MTLRPLAEGDREEFVRMHEVSAAFLEPWIPALAAGEGWHDWFDKELDKNRYPHHCRLVGVADGRIVGLFNLGEIVRGYFDSAYAGWRMNSEFAGRGYGTEGVAGMLDIAFAQQDGLGLHRVQANIMPHNERSIRLAERVGFRREGLALKYLKIGGVWRDHLMFAKLVEEHRAEPANS
jgi:ribosomal-protein-alanine N-acetyltransferase